MTVSTQAYFQNRRAAIATMHQKESVIAPLLEQALGLQPFVPREFDTDQFGTFTRDVDRPANQVETAILKANAALDMSDVMIAIASEGTFAPHPHLPYLPCNREVVVLVDRQHQLTIVGEVTSLETNFSHASVSSVEAARSFAQKIGFPAHGLVVMPAPDHRDRAHILKGIRTEDHLTEALTHTLKTFGSAHLETDMRAMHNPTRMKVIQQATQNLIQKATQVCQVCGTPGLDVVEYRRGLPCELCYHPTDKIMVAIYACQKCGDRQEVPFPHGEHFANPAECPFCNP